MCMCDTFGDLALNYKYNELFWSPKAKESSLLLFSGPFERPADPALLLIGTAFWEGSWTYHLTKFQSLLAWRMEKKLYGQKSSPGPIWNQSKTKPVGYLFHFHLIPVNKENCPLPRVNWLQSDTLSNHCSSCSLVTSQIFSESELVAESVHLKKSKVTIYSRRAEYLGVHIDGNTFTGFFHCKLQ